MSFSSLSFLYAFLPLVVILYYLSPAPRFRNGVLLLSSLFFYAWGAPKALPLLIGTAALVWLCGLGTEKGRSFRREDAARAAAPRRDQLHELSAHGLQH